jgi:hypothetical protein
VQNFANFRDVHAPEKSMEIPFLARSIIARLIFYLPFISILIWIVRAYFLVASIWNFVLVSEFVSSWLSPFLQK